MNEACGSAQKLNKGEETHPRQRVCHQNVNLAKQSSRRVFSKASTYFGKETRK